MPQDEGVVSRKFGHTSMHGLSQETKLRGVVSRERFLDAEDGKACPHPTMQAPKLLSSPISSSFFFAALGTSPSCTVRQPRFSFCCP
jgi:hypothetical protein